MAVDFPVDAMRPVRSEAAPSGASVRPQAAASPDDGVTPSFDLTLDAMVQSQSSGLSAVSQSKGSRSGELSPFGKFESFVLRSFVESMLPKDNTSFFGTGTAGDVWRSMLAERIGDEMARSGGIGIADLLAESQKGRPAAGAAAIAAGPRFEDIAAGAALPSINED